MSQARVEITAHLTAFDKFWAKELYTDSILDALQGPSSMRTPALSDLISRQRFGMLFKHMLSLKSTSDLDIWSAAVLLLITFITSMIETEQLSHAPVSIDGVEHFLSSIDSEAVLGAFGHSKLTLLSQRALDLLFQLLELGKYRGLVHKHLRQVIGAAIKQFIRNNSERQATVVKLVLNYLSRIETCDYTKPLANVLKSAGISFRCIGQHCLNEGSLSQYVQVWKNAYDLLGVRTDIEDFLFEALHGYLGALERDPTISKDQTFETLVELIRWLQPEASRRIAEFTNQPPEVSVQFLYDLARRARHIENRAVAMKTLICVCVSDMQKPMCVKGLRAAIALLPKLRLDQCGDVLEPAIAFLSRPDTPNPTLISVLLNSSAGIVAVQEFFEVPQNTRLLSSFLRNSPNAWKQLVCQLYRERQLSMAIAFWIKTGSVFSLVQLSDLADKYAGLKTKLFFCLLPHSGDRQFTSMISDLLDNHVSRTQGKGRIDALTKHKSWSSFTAPIKQLIMCAGYNGLNPHIIERYFLDEDIPIKDRLFLVSQCVRANPAIGEPIYEALQSLTTHYDKEISYPALELIYLISYETNLLPEQFCSDAALRLVMSSGTTSELNAELLNSCLYIAIRCRGLLAVLRIILPHQQVEERGLSIEELTILLAILDLTGRLPRNSQIKHPKIIAFLETLANGVGAQLTGDYGDTALKVLIQIALQDKGLAYKLEAQILDRVLPSLSTAYPGAHTSENLVAIAQSGPLCDGIPLSKLVLSLDSLIHFPKNWRFNNLQHAAEATGVLTSDTHVLQGGDNRLVGMPQDNTQLIKKPDQDPNAKMAVSVFYSSLKKHVSGAVQAGLWLRDLSYLPFLYPHLSDLTSLRVYYDSLSDDHLQGAVVSVLRSLIALKIVFCDAVGPMGYFYEATVLTISQAVTVAALLQNLQSLTYSRRVHPLVKPAERAASSESLESESTKDLLECDLAYGMIDTARLCLEAYCKGCDKFEGAEDIINPKRALDGQSKLPVRPLPAGQKMSRWAVRNFQLGGLDKIAVEKQCAALAARNPGLGLLKWLAED